MNIDNLTIGEAKQIISLLAEVDKKKDVPFRVGAAYLIRTVTYATVGIVERITGDFLEMSSASWVADTGRFHNALVNGTLSEVEPIPDEFIVAVSAIVDAAQWKHELPTEQK